MNVIVIVLIGFINMELVRVDIFRLVFVFLGIDEYIVFYR